MGQETSRFMCWQVRELSSLGSKLLIILHGDAIPPSMPEAFITRS